MSCPRTQCNVPGQGPVSQKPWKRLGPVKPFLDRLSKYGEVHVPETSRRKPLFMLRICE